MSEYRKCLHEIGHFLAVIQCRHLDRVGMSNGVVFQ